MGKVKGSNYRVEEGTDRNLERGTTSKDYLSEICNQGSQVRNKYRVGSKDHRNLERGTTSKEYISEICNQGSQVRNKYYH